MSSQDTLTINNSSKQAGIIVSKKSKIVTPSPRYVNYVEEGVPIRTPTMRKGGMIDETGAIRDLLRTGFTKFTSWCELIANIYDARGNKCLFINDPNDTKKIYLIDNGKGMSLDDLQYNYCNLYKANHEDEQVMGISGKGAKAALATLSEEKTVIIYSCNGSDHVKAIIPFDRILDRDDPIKWTDGVEFDIMTSEEINLFENLRKGENMGFTGTVIVLPYQEAANEVLSKNFDPELRKNLFPHDRFDFIFGNLIQPELFVFIDKTEKEQRFELSPYQYMHGYDHEYYKGKYEANIDVYYKNGEPYRFIWKKDEDDPSQWNEIKSDRRGTRKNSDKASHLRGWQKVGTFKFVVAMRKDDEFFDEENPKDINRENPNPFGVYDAKYINTYGRIGELNDEFSKCTIIRNEQHINQFAIEGFKASSARSDASNFAKTVLLRSELQYSVTCVQDNHMDKILGVQSNKTQINYQDFPLTLMRLLSEIKSDRWQIINSYFTTCIEEHKQKEEDELIEKQALEILNTPPNIIIETNNEDENQHDDSEPESNSEEEEELENPKTEEPQAKPEKHESIKMQDCVSSECETNTDEQDISSEDETDEEVSRLNVENDDNSYTIDIQKFVDQLLIKYPHKEEQIKKARDAFIS